MEYLKWRLCLILNLKPASHENHVTHIWWIPLFKMTNKNQVKLIENQHGGWSDGACWRWRHFLFWEQIFLFSRKKKHIWSKYLFIDEHVLVSLISRSHSRLIISVSTIPALLVTVTSITFPCLWRVWGRGTGWPYVRGVDSSHMTESDSSHEFDDFRFNLTKCYKTCNSTSTWRAVTCDFTWTWAFWLEKTCNFHHNTKIKTCFRNGARTCMSVRARAEEQGNGGRKARDANVWLDGRLVLVS